VGPAGAHGLFRYARCGDEPPLFPQSKRARDGNAAVIRPASPAPHVRTTMERDAARLGDDERGHAAVAEL